MNEGPDPVVTTVTFKTPESGDPLDLVIYSPAERNEKPVPCVVFFFGGGWVGGQLKQFAPHAEYVARRGVVGITAQYRTKGSHETTPQICVADGKSAMRWVRAHAEELGVDPNRIAASGGSAGGHVAACTGLLEGGDDPTDDLSISCQPSHLVLFNPVVDTTKSGFGAGRVGEDKQALSPVHHIRPGTVPTLIMHGTTDPTVPFENVERFSELMAEAGNDCTLVPFEGRGHGFFNSSSLGYPQGGDEDFHATMAEMDRWLVEQGILKKEVTI